MIAAPVMRAIIMNSVHHVIDERNMNWDYAFPVIENLKAEKIMNDLDYKVDIDTSEDGLAILKERWKPGGSGPLGAMKLIYTLTSIIQEERLSRVVSNTTAYTILVETNGNQDVSIDAVFLDKRKANDYLTLLLKKYADEDGKTVSDTWSLGQDGRWYHDESMDLFISLVESTIR
jgi:hypothetical protein